MERNENPAIITAKILQPTFPGIKIEYLLNDKDEIFWTKYLRHESEPVTLGAFITSLLGEFLPVKVRRDLTITLRSEGTGGTGESKGIRIQVTTAVSLVDTDNRQFSLTQAYHAEDGKLKIYLEAVVAPTQGRKFVKTCLLAHARLFGAVKIELNASMIGGSQEGVFVWARYGFVPVGSAWNTMRRWGLARLEKEPILPEQVREPLRVALLDPAPVALRRVVYLSWTVPENLRKETKTFLDSMLTCNVSWNGELLLTDPASLAWIEAYADGALHERYAKLLPAISGSEPPPVIQEKKEEESEDEEDPVANLPEEEKIQMLAIGISGGYSTEEDLRQEYPQLAKRVMALVQQLKESK
jgi:uncharacterized membrane protein